MGFSNIQKIGEGSASYLFKGNRGDKTYLLKVPKDGFEKDIEEQIRLGILLDRYSYGLGVESVRLQSGGKTKTAYVRPYAEHTVETLSVVERGEVLLDISRDLQKAHEEGIVHGNIKPSNICIYNGRLKLVEFGPSSSSRNSFHLKTERPSYRMDLYSLGMTLRALDGKRYEDIIRKMTERENFLSAANILESLKTKNTDGLEIGALLDDEEKTMRKKKLARQEIEETRNKIRYFERVRPWLDGLVFGVLGGGAAAGYSALRGYDTDDIPFWLIAGSGSIASLVVGFEFSLIYKKFGLYRQKKKLEEIRSQLPER